jgi:hypothetical protein
MKIIKIIGCIFFVIILMIVPIIQATEFHAINENIVENIEKNYFDYTDLTTIDIWDLIEFLFALLINFIDFILELSQKFIRLLLSPLIFLNYLIWSLLQILFPH